ncbi:MFS transporter [Rhodococcus pseudokoreensis]|uniref:MFS transporter n=1 Tax=Rhodococcus pseudokoreensis TaxID=2811421 RepID=A0A974W858_9NOCA|nr:MFS transporter [Rhodococcus pseudokoreensis]QSE92437.1 MFS transporter [Rhodococcus pseudokoreensis]
MSETLTRNTAAVAPPSRSRAWLVTTLLFAFLVLNFADKAVLGFAGLHIQKDLGITPQQFGLVQSAFFWLFAVGAIVLGALSSRIGVRWLLAVLMLIWIVTMVPLLGPVSFGVLLACRIVLGFAEGPAYALATHSVHSWFPPEKRALPGGIVTAGASVGPLLAAPVLTWVIVTWSWHAAFGVLIVLGGAWAVVWLIFGKNAPAHTAAADGAVELADASYRTLLTTGTVVGIALLTFFSYWSTTLKVAWLPVYLSDGLGYDTITAGRLIMLPYAFAAAGAIGAGFLSNWLTVRGVSRRVSRGFLAGGLIVAAGVSMVAFTLLSAGLPQMVFITLAFSLNTAAYAVAFTAIADIVHPSKRGPILGFLVAFYSMAGVLAPLVLGYFVGNASDKITGYGHGFALTGILMTLGGAAATFLVRPEHDAAKLSARTKENAA